MGKTVSIKEAHVALFILDKPSLNEEEAIAWSVLKTFVEQHENEESTHD